jgi:hypothetical protein
VTAYPSRLDGEIEIDPPLRWSEFRGFRFAEGAASDYPDVELRVEETREERDEGTVIVKTATAIIPEQQGGDRHYEVQEQIARAVAVFNQPDRTWSGWIRYFGADDGDVRRYGVLPDEAGYLAVVEQKANLVWPDGDVEPHPYP